MPLDGYLRPLHNDIAANRRRLIDSLRDPATKKWWNFSRRQTCALRLSFRITGRWFWPEAFGLTKEQGKKIFGIYPHHAWYYGKLFRSQVTPEMVAAKLEQLG